MRIRLICLLMAFLPLISKAQKKFYVGVNTVPLLVGTLDIRAEKQLTRTFSIQGATGFRYQNRDSTESAFVAALNRYVGLRNRGAFLSVGGRFFDPSTTEYPYIAFDVVTAWYDETVFVFDSSGEASIQDISGLQVGGSLTIGFVSQIMKRVHLDIGLQLGYSPPRDDVLNYYLPGMGFTTYGFNVYGVPGGHAQLQVSLKYNLVKDLRQLIREKD
ncbi:MAG: DUF3575 domain-containing protein [Bacteroidota bacterium]